MMLPLTPTLKMVSHDTLNTSSTKVQAPPLPGSTEVGQVTWTVMSI